MSVGALVTYRGTDREADYLPLATEEEFRRLWLPLARDLGLRWVPLFASGAPLTAADLPPVLEELNRMRQAIAARVTDSGARVRMLERAQLLITLLEGLDRHKIEEVYIG